MYKAFKKIAAASFIIMSCHTSGYSQPGEGPNQGEKPGDVPISGIEILVLAGGLLGAKKIIDSRKKN